nr:MULTISPECIES: hypothetical protein [Pseudomonas]
MPTFDFKQLDEFGRLSLKGNPLAVVLGADSLNAGVAQCLLAEGLAPGRYVVGQGTALGRVQL